MVMDSFAVVVLHVVIKAPEVSFTITSIVSNPSSVPSLAVSLRVNVVSEVTAGAVNVVEAEETLVKVIPVPGWADHVYDTASPSESVAVPDKVTVLPSPTVWVHPGVHGRRRVVRFCFTYSYNLDCTILSCCNGDVCVAV